MHCDANEVLRAIDRTIRISYIQHLLITIITINKSAERLSKLLQFHMYVPAIVDFQYNNWKEEIAAIQIERILSVNQRDNC